MTMAIDGSLLSVPEGGVIFEQGDTGDCAYIIERGEVEIVLRHGDERVQLARRRQGEIFGEMAIMDHTHRSASAIALEACELLPISREQLAKRIERTDPVLRLCLEVILRRFRDTMSQWTRAGDKGASPKAYTPDSDTTPSGQESALHEIRLERELRQALDRGEFLLHYQPILSLADRRVAGFEALIRWHHPVRGFISPALFLPSAEANGLIVDIGRWVLDEACAALSRFRRLIPDGDALFMGVNVSGRDIEDERFLETLDGVLARQDVDPEKVKLEITESLLMDKPDIAVEVLGACKARGLTIAIDDFGTGYSSLSYLHRFPIDTLKIDRSFVDGIGQGHAANQIIAAIIGLAKQLELPIVAEGIEQPEQGAWLLEHGCEFGQGFHFARPMAEPEASAFLKESDVASDQLKVATRPPRSAA